MKSLKGQKTLASNDGKTIFNQGGNTLKSTDPAAGIMSTYWIGELLANIVGGTLDGVTYGTYILTVNLHHNFSDDYPNLTPLYEFWRDYQYAYEQVIIANDLGDVASGGVYTRSTNHSMVRSKFTPGAGEYLQFQWIITRTSGTVTISPKAIRLIPHIKFFNIPLTITTASGQGGGGGVLYETFNFYI